ncbi:ribosome biogenesis protein URB2 [Aspergillus saccharolyticus JOP 1030-1]|uniref:Nucleolar 27S pre-rRNA processing Urb2/Npa2 C-terminal domain-containing protein n=1 Tax=Aspergillus saccharolyticus JOP 1030-1 TaxID=1450539 RepID=A0A319APR9_9EURO|nr:hypothetical protein BP01DRAFT_312309 [Aspergillus saccharolyticus JOP 1030-1]PYH48402.1 hypothetical protein BP01DRAFT_312309 [Aspergillus saccharolyticus JOP 1030-1]
MPSVAERPRSSQEALLRLEKGTASSTTQLNDAANIIGLDLALCASHPEINRAPHFQNSAAPKAEWVLRWLLKRLRTGKNYRVDAASFLLLRQLIDLIPPKTLATTLKDQKFLGIVHDAITDLEADVLAGLGGGTTELLTSGSESSHTLGDSPHRHGDVDKKGTKRKRSGADEPDAMDIDDPPRTPTSCFVAFIRALDCLYSLVMLVERTFGVDDVASSHLKHALKGEPESVAVTLQRSFRLATVITTQLFHAQQTTDLQHLLYVLPAMFDLWELRSSRRDDSEKVLSNECFSKHCFESALRLQCCVHTIRLDTDERAHVLHGLERLIALHVVLPARASFFERGGSGIDYSASEPDWSPVKPVSDTFRPLLCVADSPDQSTGVSAGVQKQVLPKTAELLPDFFDIAARTVPRDTFRRQNHEGPWLETLFVAVAELAFSVVKSENTAAYLSEFVAILERLFRVVLARDIKLSLHTLLTHAAYTGLLKEGLSQVEWSLTALLIELGSDIFLPNSGLNDSEKLLKALLEKIFLHWRGGVPNTNDSYRIIKKGIVIPLLRGFVGARDLPNFMQIWYEQLIEVEEARSQDRDLNHFIVWEDNDVCNEFSDLMRNPLTYAHSAAQMRAAAVEIRGEDGKLQNSAGAYAQIVILESGFRRRDLSFEDRNEDLTSIIQTVTSTLSSGQKLHWRWRLWRLARSLLENNVQSTDNELGAAIISLVATAAQSIQRVHQGRMKKVCAPLECFEAFQFALTAIKTSSNPEQFRLLTNEVTTLIKSVSDKDAAKAIKSSWDGRAETLTSPTTLALAYFVSLVRNPDLWPQVDSETRQSLFAHVLSLATSQYKPSPSTLETVNPDSKYLQAWASLVCHEYLLNAPSITIDLIAVLSERVKADASNRKLYIESLQRIPAPLVTRGQRAVLLDLLQEVIAQEGNTPEVTVGVLSLMAKLAEMPKSTAALTSNWEPLWTVAKAVSLQGSDIDLQIMKAFRNLHRAVVAKLLVVSDDERQRLFKKMYRKVSAKALKLQSLNRDSMDCFYLRISLSQLWINRETLEGVFDETELATCRKKVFDLLVAEVKSVKTQCKKQQLEDTITLIKILDALEDFEDLALDHAEVEKFLSKIESYVEKSVDSASSLRRLIRRRVLAGRGSEKSITKPVIQCAESLPLQQMYSEEQRIFIRSTSARFRTMTADELTRVIQDIRNLGFVGENAEYHLLVAGLAIASLPSVEDKESQTGQELGLVFTEVTDALLRNNAIEPFTFASECLDIILRNQSRCVTQFNIDNLLGTIAVCTSKSGPCIDPAFAGTVYIRLCRLMGLLLGIHRQKLGGRFHLINPVVGGLLDCLFARSKKRSRSMLQDKKLGQQPYWLAPLQASHAVHFTRLLTSLCDPTVSAVSRPTQSGTGYEGLTDQTKKAKRIAGQYLQYLIQDYTQSALRGSLSPEVKAAIIPGLYAVLDVMSRDTMRALNAGLDVSGRAVFKALYDDYVKFGKWNKG